MQNMLNMQNMQNNMYKICNENANKYAENVNKFVKNMQNMHSMQSKMLKVCYKYSESE